MNSKKIFGIFIGLFILVLLGVSCSQGTSQPGSSTPVISPTPVTNLSQSPASKEATITEFVPQGKMVQRNEANAVTIEAVLQSKLTVGSKELTLNITMDTHSVDLDTYDLINLATLRDSQGRQFKIGRAHV